MAKRGILEHEKTMMLADALGIMEPYAVGLLEVFWHWVAKYRPHGDVSGVKPSLFARAIRYTGDADLLWRTLGECGFLDCGEERVLVHDWSEHADNSVHQLLKKRHESFADGSGPFMRNKERFVKSTSAVHETFTNGSRLPEPEPEPEPVPEPKPVLVPPPPGAAMSVRESAAMVYEAYPRKEGRSKALTAIEKAAAALGSGRDMPRMNSPDAFAFLRERVTAFARSPAGNAGRFVPHPAAWFNAGRYLDDEREWQRGSDQGNQSAGRGIAKEDAAFSALQRAIQASEHHDAVDGLRDGEG